jgi:hypothetical protein
MLQSGLPKDLVRDYWNRVRDLLIEKYGLAPTAATQGVKQFRQVAILAGETIYNTDPVHIAESIHKWVTINRLPNSVSEKNTSGAIRIA